MTATRATILERWTIPLPPDTHGGGKWFRDWALRSPKQVSTHLTAGWHAYHALQDYYGPRYLRLLSAHEYFGGVGAQSLVIEELINPHLEHSVFEISPDAVDHLTRVLPPHVDVQHADSYAPSSRVPADIVGLDFGDFTIWKARNSEPHSELLDYVFHSGAKGVVLTDVAGPHLHLHRERYETLLGKGSCQTYDSYLYHLADWVWYTYGYKIIRGCSHRWSTVMAFVPSVDETFYEEDIRAAFIPTPSEPVGFVLLEEK